VNSNPQNYWNIQSSKVPPTKTVSNYAITKEKLFPPGATVCDLGASTGVDSLYFLEKGHTVMLVDISNQALESAKEKIENNQCQQNASFHMVDLSNGTLPFENNYFDVVYSRLSLHYFAPNTLIKLFKEIHRILSLAGSSFIAVKSPNDLEEMSYLKQTALKIEPGVFDDNGIIKTRFTIEQYQNILKIADINNPTLEIYSEMIKPDDYVKSGLNEMQYIEIVFSKSI